MSALEADDWRQLAECRSLPPDMFFPERGDNDAVKAAKEICARCPVVDECLDDAFETHEMFGIRGGMSGRERRNAAKTRERRCAICRDRFTSDRPRKLCGKPECKKEAHRARQEKYLGRTVVRMSPKATTMSGSGSTCDAPEPCSITSSQEAIKMSERTHAEPVRQSPVRSYVSKGAQQAATAVRTLIDNPAELSAALGELTTDEQRYLCLAVIDEWKITPKAGR